jgi:Uma2 family endonuclease
MQVTLPDVETRARIESDRPMDDEEFFDFCMNNPDLKIEREANGEIVLMPPAGGESSFRNNDIQFELTTWSRKDGRGRVFGPDVSFVLPSGAVRGPDAAWILKTRIEALSREQKRRFLPLCPDFVIELLSPSDRISKAKLKMQEWIDNGASLGWMLDPEHRTVWIYRPEQEPEQIKNPLFVDGEGPVEGFRLDVAVAWEDL